MEGTRRQRSRWSPASAPMVLAVALLLVVTAGVAPATSQSAGDAVDFATIQAGDVPVASDPSGTSATVTVGTTVDGACEVVYGLDPTFGNLATDKDMASSGHRDHHVVLGGLRPRSHLRLPSPGQRPGR